ncbi:MAG: hypothetical protein K8M05_00830, partial [Deltaproteobacteria bacterium]|nr:hypothetical protein [Kofleriaceae bacterium]
MIRAEEGQVRHHDDGRGRAASRQDGERAIDDAGERAGGRVAQDDRAVLVCGGGDVVAVGGDQHAIDGGGARG